MVAIAVLLQRKPPAGALLRLGTIEILDTDDNHDLAAMPSLSPDGRVVRVTTAGVTLGTRDGRTEIPIAVPARPLVAAVASLRPGPDGDGRRQDVRLVGGAQ